MRFAARCDVSFCAAIRANLAGHRRAPDARSRRLRPRPIPARACAARRAIAARHTVGMLDPLDAGDVAGASDDGLPADAGGGDRRVRQSLFQAQARRRRRGRRRAPACASPPSSTACPGTQSRSTATSNSRTWRRSPISGAASARRRALARLAARDALPRAAAAARDARWTPTYLALAASLPLLIDESDATLDAFPSARRCGYTRRLQQELQGILQVAAQRRALRAVERRAGPASHFLSGEDLTTQAGLAVQQDLALVGAARPHACRAQWASLRRWLRRARRRRSRAAGASSPRIRLSTRDDGGSPPGDTRRHDRPDARSTAPGFASRAEPDWDVADAAVGGAAGRIRGCAMNYATPSPQEIERGNRTTRHHHERRHRPHGHEPASGPLDLRDPRARRRRAGRRPPRHARSDPGRTQSPTSSSSWRARNGVARWTTDLDRGARQHATTRVYFDSASTGLRPQLIEQAIAAGKHIYTEKPVAPTLARSARALSRGAGAPASSTASCRTSSGCRACSS